MLKTVIYVVIKAPYHGTLHNGRVLGATALSIMTHSITTFIIAINKQRR